MIVYYSVYVIEKTAHSLSKVVYAKALKQQKIKCLLIISIKQMR